MSWLLQEYRGYLERRIRSVDSELQATRSTSSRLWHSRRGRLDGLQEALRTLNQLEARGPLPRPDDDDQHLAAGLRGEV